MHQAVVGEEVGEGDGGNHAEVNNQVRDVGGEEGVAPAPRRNRVTHDRYLRASG